MPTDSWIEPQTAQNELVSVIIPSYNRSELIEKAILSVRHQTYRPIECIVIDDGSTDKSVEVINTIISSWTDDTFSIELIQQPNSGAPAARNAGLHRATGDFIQFLDSDDELYPEKISNQVQYLLDNPSIDAVYGNWHQGTKNSKELVRAEQWKDVLTQIYGGRAIANFSMLLRSSLTNKIGLWDESLKRNQEVDYFLRAVVNDARFGYIENQITGLWRDHEGDRIVSSSGALNALHFHDKWFSQFSRLNLWTEDLKKTASKFYFWYAMDLEPKNKDKAINYLFKAYKLNQNIREFNTKKMSLIRKILGDKKGIAIWYHLAKRNS